MNKRTKIAAIGIAGLAIAAGGTSLAVAGSGDDDTGDSEAPLSGSALDQASAAALDHLGEGEVTDTEAGDEESYYEVEVTKPDGGQVDVQLDRGFNVVGSKTDHEDGD